MPNTPCVNPGPLNQASRPSSTSLPTIAVVVPALAAGGGVPAVAEFLCAQIERTRRYRLKLVSLATSSRDECSLRLSSPATWRSNPGRRAGTWQGREFTHFGARIAEVEFLRMAPTPLLRRALEECDLVQVVSGSPAPALALAGCNRPIVMQVATRAMVERRKALDSGSVGARTWRRLMARIIDRFDDRALCMADAVMVENQWMLRHARKVVSAGKTTVSHAPPGVDCGIFSPSSLRDARLVRDPYILFVGRISDPRKNVILLCRAYMLLCSQFKNAPDLILAGHGELPGDARSILAQPDMARRVKLVAGPSAERLRALYQNATALAVPSDEEGFGMVVVEAMACGVPVVATRCGGPEEIITNGMDGYLVPLDDAEALAAHLRLLCSPALNCRMSSSARQTVLSRFSAEVAFRPFLQAYERLLA